MTKRASKKVDVDFEAHSALMHESFEYFVRTMLPVGMPGKTIIWAPYLSLLCSLAQDVVEGRISRLIINIPPRHLKSFLFSIALPAWIFGRDPKRELMCVSYAHELARRLGADTLRLMASAEYRECFDAKFATSNPSPSLLKTVQGGSRRSTSLGGVATGEGADFLIVDDPQKPSDVASEIKRAKSNLSFKETFLSRRSDPGGPKPTAMIVIMQRLHEYDFIGAILERPEGWTHISLPAIAEADEHIEYQAPFGKATYRRQEGEALNPERISLDDLADIRNDSGEAVFSGHYQQRPTPSGGALVKASWFRTFNEQTKPQKFERIVQSWDCAVKTEQWHDFSVCITLGEVDGRIYIINVVRRRVNYPELKKLVLELARFWEADIVVIEDKASGQQLLQELPSLGFYKAKAAVPVTDKQMRLATQTSKIEGGQVYIPSADMFGRLSKADGDPFGGEPWMDEFLHELVMFPNARFDDQADALSQALNFMTKRTGYDNAIEWMKGGATGSNPSLGSKKIIRYDGINYFKQRPGTFLAGDGTVYQERADGYFHIEERHQESAIGNGWREVGPDEPAREGSYVDSFGRWPPAPGED